MSKVRIANKKLIKIKPMTGLILSLLFVAALALGFAYLTV